MLPHVPNAGQKRALARLLNPALAAARGGSRLLRRRSGPPPDPRAPEGAAAVRSVLAVRLDAIGDVLLTEPALEVLRRRFPNARIDLVANPASSAVLAGNPNLDHLVGYRAPWHAAWRGGSVAWDVEAARFWGVARTLRAQRYDLGVELRGDLRDIGFLAACAPRVVVGSGLRGGSGLLDIDVAVDPRSHQVTQSAAIAACGTPIEAVRPPALHLAAAHHAAAQAALEGIAAGPVALHLGAGFESKRLPVPTFAATIAALEGAGVDRHYVVVGGAEDDLLARQLQAAIARPERVHVFTGRLGLLETAAVLARCSVFIGNDSAPMHLAAAVGIPAVACFGPSEPWKFHPYGVAHRLVELPLDCRPCDYVHCRWNGDLRFQCMTRQSPEAIAAAAAGLLGQAQGPGGHEG